MKLHAEPPIDEWCRQIKSVAAPRIAPRIATGHQPWFWHPGILVKYVAAVEFAKASDGEAINIVVDQDTIDSLAIDLPYVVGERIEVERLQLAAIKPDVPTGMQMPVSADAVLASLAGVAEDAHKAHEASLNQLADAWRKAASESFTSLAEQVAFVLNVLMADLGVQFDRELRATALLQNGEGNRIVADMLAEARACVRCYNAAVAATPAAGVTPLSVEPDRVELPLWCLAFDQPRQRVYADLTDSKPILTLADGSEITDSKSLAPRALLLTALMRQDHCDLFIHGTGGGVYDAITDQWWQQWRGESLSPIAVISTDMHLEFDVRLTERADYLNAVWFAHHLPHNVDRYLPNVAEHEPVKRRKQAILKEMSATTDRRLRATLFAELKMINRQLAVDSNAMIQRANDEVEHARLGMVNSKSIKRRDWSFVLYPSNELQALVERVAKRLGS